MSTWELLKAPGVAIVIYIYSHIMLQALAFTASMLALLRTINACHN
jgi:hypothetical protein